MKVCDQEMFELVEELKHNTPIFDMMDILIMAEANYDIDEAIVQHELFSSF